MTVQNAASTKKMAESLDSLAETLIHMCRTKTRNCPVHFWVTLSPIPFWATSGTSHPNHLYGFVSLAGELGVLRYVSFRVTANPRLLKVEGDSDDIIWRLIYGAGDCTYRREFGPLIEGSKKIAHDDQIHPWLDPRRNRAVRRIQGIIAFDHQERYNAIKDLIQKMKETPQKAAGFEKTLRPLHKQIVTENSSRAMRTEFRGPVTVSFQSNDGSVQEKTIPYGHAIAELLEQYGVGNPLRGWWRQRSWQWSSSSTSSSNMSQRSSATPSTRDYGRRPLSSDDSDADSLASAKTTDSYA